MEAFVNATSKMNNGTAATMMGMANHAHNSKGAHVQQFLGGALTMPPSFFMGGGGSNSLASSVSMSSMDSAGGSMSGSVLSRSGSPRAMTMSSGMLSSPRSSNAGHSAFGDHGSDFSVSGNPDDMSSQSIWAQDGYNNTSVMWRGEGGMGMATAKSVGGMQDMFGKGPVVGGSSQADALWGDREGEVGRLADYLRNSHVTETSIDGTG